MAAFRVLAILCTYNERDNIETLIPEIWRYAPESHILVVDDNSPDGTGKIVEAWSQRDPRVHLLSRPGKLGLGTATLAGLRYAVENDYTFVVNLDADFSHHPRHLPALLACMDRADVAIGSRYVAAGAVVGWSLKRRFMSKAINWYARLLLRLSTLDNSGAFRCFRVSKLRQLDFEKFLARGYAIQEEMLFRCRKVGCRFEETPIVFEDRRRGQSKINWREAVSTLWIIFRLGVLGR